MVNVCALMSAVLEPLLTGVIVSRDFYKYTSYKQRMMRKKLGGIWYVQIKMEDYIPFTFCCSPTTVSTEHYGWSLPDEKMQMRMRAMSLSRKVQFIFTRTCVDPIFQERQDRMA